MMNLTCYWKGLAEARQGHHQAAARLLLTAFASPHHRLSRMAGSALSTLYGVTVA